MVREGELGMDIMKHVIMARGLSPAAEGYMDPRSDARFEPHLTPVLDETEQAKTSHWPVWLMPLLVFTVMAGVGVQTVGNKTLTLSHAGVSLSGPVRVESEVSDALVVNAAITDAVAVDRAGLADNASRGRAMIDAAHAHIAD